MNRLIIVGSPRVDGRCAALANQLFDACVDECPDDAISMISVASLELQPCNGCDLCRDSVDDLSREPLPERQGSRMCSGTAKDSSADDGDLYLPRPSVQMSDADLHQCIFDDEFAEVRKHLDSCDELVVVTPVYFASVPSQFKALLDRMQPYFWSTLRNQPKRSLTIHVVGEGGDPHGFDPLVGTVRSALGCAGFRLDRVLDWVGKIDISGTILEDAKEHTFDQPASSIDASKTSNTSAEEGKQSSARSHQRRSHQQTCGQQQTSRHRRRNSRG